MEYAERWDVNYQPRIPDPKWGDGRVGDGEKIEKRGEIHGLLWKNGVTIWRLF